MEPLRQRNELRYPGPCTANIRSDSDIVGLGDGEQIARPICSRLPPLRCPSWYFDQSPSISALSDLRLLHFLV
jgi:hypothetical protein